LKGDNFLIINELQSGDLRKYNSRLLELLIDNYMMNFQLTVKQANLLCSNKLKLLAEYIEQGSAILIAAIDRSELIGFMWLYKHDYFGEKRLHINQIIVDANFRGKGIGKQLILEAEKNALEEGIKTIDLFVSEINSGAFDLYDKLGFETERRYMKKKL
jgi:ribosomal protein S18 acetylase RimI-like enzyme